ncbi:hypothetical protein L596_004033 [Steinernema carpocapsae]|uniref:Uncharacterized protein n=1 Tax=Steinernema carpocapsae TaxID=34508 RepID=A0A4U8UUL9_STECR|nr:hypothetical protein L596_004033 [Steinernema carpocapsae]
MQSRFGYSQNGFVFYIMYFYDARVTAYFIPRCPLNAIIHLSTRAISFSSTAQVYEKGSGRLELVETRRLESALALLLKCTTFGIGVKNIALKISFTST